MQGRSPVSGRVLSRNSGLGHQRPVATAQIQEPPLSPDRAGCSLAGAAADHPQLETRGARELRTGSSAIASRQLCHPLATGKCMRSSLVSDKVRKRSGRGLAWRQLLVRGKNATGAQVREVRARSQGDLRPPAAHTRGRRELPSRPRGLRVAMAPGGAEPGAHQGDAGGSGPDPKPLLPGICKHVAQGDNDRFGFPGTFIPLYEC